MCSFNEKTISKLCTFEEKTFKAKMCSAEPLRSFSITIKNKTHGPQFMGDSQTNCFVLVSALRHIKCSPLLRNMFPK